MKSLLDKLKGRMSREKFIKADLEEIPDVLVNPDRGWFQIFPFTLGEEPDLETVKQCLLPGERLVLVIPDIGRYAESELPGEALEQLRRILSFFAELKKDILLRVVYDRDGKAMEHEPSLFQRVSTHMEQIAGVVAEYGESVFVYQGILVGNWGEMHGSRYLDEKHISNLSALLRDRLRDRVFLAMRTPAQVRMQLETGTAEEAAGKRIGLFDDSILGSETDRGTYSTDAVKREEEIAFSEKLCARVPNGGELVWGEGYMDTLSQEEIIRRLGRIHVTYLNRQHDKRVLDRWKNTSCTCRGVFYQKSFYDYVEAYMGYRFIVQDVWLERPGGTAPDAGSGERLLRLKLQLKLRNLGFAPIYRRTESVIIWQDADGRGGELPVGLDLSAVTDSKSFECETRIAVPAEAVHPVRLSLLTKRSFDGEVIRFANRQTGDGRVLLGEW